MTDNQAGDAAMDEGIAALQASSERLAEMVTEVSSRLNTTQEMQKRLDEQQRELKVMKVGAQRQRKISFWLIVSVVLDVVLSVAVGLGYLRIDSNSERIGNIQDRTSSEVLCPLYALLVAEIDSIDLNELPPEERKQTEKEIEVIVQGYNALNCEAAAAA